MLDYSVDVFPRNLKMIREGVGFTQKDLALSSGLTPTAISHFECGRRLPCLQNLVSLSNGMNVSPSAFMVQDLIVTVVLDKRNVKIELVHSAGKSEAEKCVVKVGIAHD